MPFAGTEQRLDPTYSCASAEQPGRPGREMRGTGAPRGRTFPQPAAEPDWSHWLVELNDEEDEPVRVLIAGGLSE
jgi:hypothetical protein